MFWNRKENLRGFRKKEIKVLNKPVYNNPYFRKSAPNMAIKILKKPKRILACLIILGLAYFLFYSDVFKIKSLEVKGNQELTQDRIRSEAQKELAKSRFLIFKKSNMFIYDKKDAKDALWNAFVLDSIDIKKRYPNKIIISLKEKIPNLTFYSQGKFYYLDLNGTVTNEVPENEVKKSFPRVEDQNIRKISLRDKILPKNVIDAVFLIKDQLKSKTNADVDIFSIPLINCPKTFSGDPLSDSMANANGSTNSNINSGVNANKSTNTNKAINGVNLNKNSNLNSSQEALGCDLEPITYDLSVKSNEGWEALFTVKDDISVQLERLKTYLLRRAYDKIARDNIIYIDLRFGDKLYIKEK